MQYRKLGRTDIEVSTISVGFWAVASPDKWGPQDDENAIAAVHTALDAGVNLFDTAEAYGEGESERLLGRALGTRRDEVVIASKVRPANAAPDDLIAACEASLRRLNTDHIDLYQLHWPNREVPLADTFGAMERLREQGKVRVIGVSNFGVGDLQDALAVTRLETDQLPYNLLFRAIEDEILSLCNEHSIGVLAYSPLMHGLLTGKFDSLDDVPTPRARSRHFAGSRPMARHGEPGAEAELAAALDAVRRIADEHTLTMGQLALAWVAHQPGVASVIAGARNPQQAQQNALASDIMLNGETLVALNKATAELKAALGPNPDMWNGSANSRFR
jgi:aryl-alcohol dehydrogenase-like predicted oxidoreductase